MKKIIVTICIFSSFITSSQEISSFFDGKTFQLDYFFKNGVHEELDLLNPNDPSGNTNREIPQLALFFNSETDKLETMINGYCNVTSAKYLIHDNYLEVLERGGTTLSDCGGDEETDFFNPITGNVYMQQPAKKIYFEFTTDQKGLWLWSDENHKLFFSEKVLSVEENQLEKVISIYPNPSKEFVNIDVKSNSIEIYEVSIIDFQGRIICNNLNDFKTIDISKLSKGIYFVKVVSKNKTSITKKIIKE